MLLLVAGRAQAGGVPVDLANCAAEQVSLAAHLSVLDAAFEQADFDGVLALPASAWRQATPNSLRRGVGYEPRWLSLTVRHDSPQLCHYYLFLGASRARDQQVYQQSEQGWRHMLAGPRYPLGDWVEPLRLPAFPLELAPGQESRILIRAESPLLYTLKPMLLSEPALSRMRMAETLADGMMYGMVVLLVLFSLVLGYLFRLPLLLAHALWIFLYSVQVFLTNGYAFVRLWPDATQLDIQLTSLAGLCSCLAVIGYLRLLLKVRLQHRALGLYLTACQFGLVAVWCAGSLLPQGNWMAPGGMLDHALGSAIFLGLLLVMANGTRMRLGYDWFCYLMPSLILTQVLLHYRLLPEWLPSAFSEYSWLSVSILPGAVLLGYTLVSQVALSRQRETQALADIEEVKQSERERLERTAELRTNQMRHSLRGQNMLLARISHDLRAPLQGIIGSARQLGDGLAVQKGIRSIERNARQQLELIDELLEYSHNELKQLELMVAPGYLFGFLRETQEQAQFLAARNNNRLVCHFAHDLPLLVNADFRRLRQVLVNLLANAAKFTRYGQIRFEVTCTAVAEEVAVVHFEVADNGSGVLAEDRERLFEPFARGKNAALYEGSGLGLYLVRNMLERMGSGLSYEPIASGGSRFGFSLELALAQEQELEQVFIESHVPAHKATEQRVMVVDDVPITREMLYELLAGYGYDPILCDSGEQALTLLQQQPVDVLITDQLMPGMDGWTLLAALRETWPHLPVILYSASPPRRPPSVSPGCDFDAILLKPADTGDLLATLARLLERPGPPLKESSVRSASEPPVATPARSAG